MTFPFTLVVIELITLHMIDGRVVQINPREVVQLLTESPTRSDLLPDAVRCVVRFTDGTFTAVVEECAVVRKLMEAP